MESYFVIDCEDRRWERFSNNYKAKEYLEKQVNEYGFDLDRFLVLKCDNGDFLNISSQKAIRVSVGGM